MKLTQTQINSLRPTLAQDRRISELATMAEILRDSGFSETDLYKDILVEWTKAIKVAGEQALTSPALCATNVLSRTCTATPFHLLLRLSPCILLLQWRGTVHQEVTHAHPCLHYCRFPCRLSCRYRRPLLQ